MYFDVPHSTFSVSLLQMLAFQEHNWFFSGTALLPARLSNYMYKTTHNLNLHQKDQSPPDPTSTIRVHIWKKRDEKLLENMRYWPVFSWQGKNVTYYCSFSS